MGVGGAPRNGRRSEALAAPRLTIRGGRPLESALTADLPQQPIEALRAALQSIACERDPALPPFGGGLVGYLGWGAAAWSERLPQRLGPDELFPEADLLHVSELIAFDHRQGRTWAIASGSGGGADSPEARSRALADRVLAVFDDRRTAVRWPEALRRPAAQSLGTRLVGGSVSRETARSRNARRRGPKLPEPRPVGGGESAYKAAVRRALEYIRAGDIFQVVLSQRFELPDCDGFSLYRTLRAASPADENQPTAPP